VPSFTVAGPNLQAIGPIVEIRIAVPAAVEAIFVSGGQPVPSPVAMAAMIDTGASGTVIQAGVAARLGLHPVGVVAINTPSSTGVLCAQYAVRLIFPNNVIGEAVVIEAPLEGQHVQGLVGRDVLSQAVLVYIGYTNQFTMSF
jgi:predicted aspartyl protease